MNKVLDKSIISINNQIIKSNYLYNLPYNSELKLHSRELRKSNNLSEILFWKKVKNKQFHNLDFDRQKIIGNYIVDFYVKEFGIIVEIDGSSHIGKEDYDEIRETFLENLGIKVFKTLDLEVKVNLEGVLKGLEEFIIFNFVEVE